MIDGRTGSESPLRPFRCCGKPFLAKRKQASARC